jgi:Na+/H+-dicarboxylate symporter
MTDEQGTSGAEVGGPASERGGMQLYTKILIGMLVGIVAGLLLGPSSSVLSHDGVLLGTRSVVTTEAGGKEPVAEAKGLARAELAGREGGALRVRWTLEERDAVRLGADGVAAEAGSSHEGWVDASAPGVRTYATVGQRLVDATEWLGRIFLAMIKMVVVPLVFFSLVVGIASLGDFRKLGKMGGGTLVYFTLTTAVAVAIGVVLANVLAPGALVSDADRAMLLGSYDAGAAVKSAASAPSMIDQLVGIVPENPFAALAKAEMLQIIFFATMVGIALTLMPIDHARPVVDLASKLNDAMVVLVHLAMKLAPVGVAALLFKVVGSTGLGVLVALAAYGGVVLLGLALHVALVYAPVVRFGAKLPFFGFLGSIRAALVVAFSTSSSSATLPVTMRVVEDNLDVTKEVSSFVLPIGATVNMDGTALYQGVAAIFIAQVYGIELGLAEQTTIVVSATLASVGAAGVPGAGMLTLAMVLAAIGVPVQGLALIIGIDRLLDMFRTTMNVVGDTTAAVLVARVYGDDLKVTSPREDAADPEHGIEGVLRHPTPHRVPVDDAEPAPRDETGAGA